jgi:hypothetical protein
MERLIHTITLSNDGTVGHPLISQVGLGKWVGDWVEGVAEGGHLLLGLLNLRRLDCL